MQIRSLTALSLTLLIGVEAMGTTFALPAEAAGPSTGSTLLLPLTPKIDPIAPASSPVEPEINPGAATPVKTNQAKRTPAASPKAASRPVARPAARPATAVAKPQQDELAEPLLMPETPILDTAVTQSDLREGPIKISAESDNSAILEANATEDDLQIAEAEQGITEDVTLKGAIQIIADDTEYDQEKNTFLGTGNAVAIIGGQNSKLEADMILYDQNAGMIDARGNVKILRQGQLTTGTSFKFKVASDEYLITNPDTEMKGTVVVARTGYGTKEGINFRKGTMTLPEPIHIGKNSMYGGVSAGQEVAEKMTHPDAFLPAKPSFTFKARKMVYENYKESGNLTVFGGKLAFGRFNVPLPKFTATVGQENNVMFPVTPMLTSNIQTGGINVGPSFNYAVGKTGKLHWAPMIQFGGRSASSAGTDSNSGSIGLSGQVGFSNKRMSGHIAYGSVSNLFVADYKAQITKNLRFQSGINRYLEDGMNGYRRARYILEAVHTTTKGGIPFLNGINFRSAAGWAKDNPQLVQQSSQEYADLFGQNQYRKQQASGFRLSEQITTSTHPIFAVGDDKYGIKSFIFGGVGLNAYSSGDARLMGQLGPTIDLKLNRFRLQTTYFQTAVRGNSPFVFDQFIQGTRSVNITGDVRVCKWLTVGGGYGYNLNDKMAYSKTLMAAIGPEDFKLVVQRSILTNMNRFGFDVLYGAPIPFQKLVLKGSPDHGQLGGNAGAGVF
ncbi:MAG: hypothetical protein J0H83_05410 [Candidatus Melainabacteria bacterium]|nr:hypothetical protein [Candidatus Melainabacteria bacterium]MBX9674798.1 hypothetical protein [Candidatus Obscuribacterales bacterium]